MTPQSGLQVYLIPAPFMYDAAESSSNAVAYRIAPKNGSNQYTLTIQADPVWINSDERVLPVTVDPVLMKDGLWIECGTHLSKQGSPNAVKYQTARIFYVSVMTAPRRKKRRRVYTKSNSLPELPSSAVVTVALLYYQMPAYSPGCSSRPDGLVVTAREVLGGWDSATITWNNQPLLQFHSAGLYRDGQQ